MNGTQTVHKIKLYNRDGVNLWLEDSGLGYYTLETDGDTLYKRYLRIIGDDENKPTAIDPPGGPFISVGSIYDGYRIKEISFPPVRFYLEKDETSN